MILISFVSAYSYGYYGSPLDYLDSEWIFFGLVFIVLFAIIFYALNKSMSEQTIAGVISFAISLFVTIIIQRKGWLDDYSGDGFVSLVLIAVFLIIIVFLISVLHKNLGLKGVSLSLIAIWIGLNVIDPYEYLPWEFIESFMPVYDFISSWFVLLGLIVLTVFAFNKDKKEREREQISDIHPRFFPRNLYRRFSQN